MGRGKTKMISFAGLPWHSEPAKCAEHLATKGFDVESKPHTLDDTVFTTGTGSFLGKEAELFATFFDGGVDTLSVTLDCGDFEEAEFLLDEMLTGLIAKYGRPDHDTDDESYHWQGIGGLVAGIEEDNPDKIGLMYMSPRRVEALMEIVESEQRSLREDIDSLL